MTGTRGHVVLLGWQQPQAGRRESPYWALCLEGSLRAAPQLCLFPQCDEFGGPRGHAHCFSPRTHSEHFPEARNPLSQWPLGPLPQVHPPQGRPPCRGAPLDLGSGAQDGTESGRAKVLAAQGQARGGLGTSSPRITTLSGRTENPRTLNPNLASWSL